MSFVNGRLLPTQLTTCYQNPRDQIRKGAPATSLTRMSQRSHAKEYGFILIADGYRSYDQQKKVFLSVYRLQSSGNGPFNDVRWWQGRRYVRYTGTGTVAVPGTSNHGLGLALDLKEPYASGGPKHRWLEQNCAFYGWYWEGAAFGEPWHWTFRGFPIRPMLRRGIKNQGNAVTAWQCVLRYDLHLSATAMKLDGIPGPLFEKYTKQWQKERGLVADGIVGDKSWVKAGLK